MSVKFIDVMISKGSNTEVNTTIQLSEDSWGTRVLLLERFNVEMDPWNDKIERFLKGKTWHMNFKDKCGRKVVISLWSHGNRSKYFPE